MKRIIAVIILTAALSACNFNGSDVKIKDIESKEPPESVSELNDRDFENPENADIYDGEKVVRAYINSDASMLDEFNLKIYDAAYSAVSEFYDESMTQQEAALAAHDYLVVNCTYDLDELSLTATASEYSDCPYGALINGKAICLGYTTAYQLFMDMLGIECITVSGEALGEEHAWNMVRLDGKWYHVDCTWDDFVPDDEKRPPFHLYTFVTDEVMRTNHIWDDSHTPAADNNDLNYYYNNGLLANSASELKTILENSLLEGAESAEAAIPCNAEFEIPNLSNGRVVSVWENDFGEYSANIYYLSKKRF